MTRRAFALSALALVGCQREPAVTADPTPTYDAAFLRLITRSRAAAEAGRVWTQADHTANVRDLQTGVAQLAQLLQPRGKPLPGRGSARTVGLHA